MAQARSARATTIGPMPIYEFECGECGERFEDLVAAGTERGRCPSCGAAGAGRRLSTFGLSRQPTPAQKRRMEDARGIDRDGARQRFKGNLAKAASRAASGRDREPDSAQQRREAARRGLPARRSTCTLCPLAETRTKVVFGAGDADADLMFIGEAPGCRGGRRGLPFVGRAGGLLNELLEGIGLSRESVFIANTLMCRPPGNRDPQPDELDACRPYLLEKVRLIEPKVIVTLGNFATKLITGEPDRDHAGPREAAGPHARRADRSTSSRSSIRPPRCGRRRCGRR